MSNSKFNFEEQLKKQIEKREIIPTRDLWSEIENQTVKNIPVKSKVNWFLAAALLLLVASMGIGFLFNNDKKIEPQLAKIQVLPEKKGIEKEVSAIKPKKTETFNLNNNNIVSAPKIKKLPITSDPKTIISPTEIEKEEHIPLEISKNIFSKPTILASRDSVAIPKNRKKYVDASTLLFSVEHKDVIENTKDGSNVAIIDLNSK